MKLCKTDEGKGQTMAHNHTTRAYISLGSNLSDKGRDPAHNLTLAVAELAAAGLVPMALSQVYRTEPQGYTDQPWFSNQVAALDCPKSMTPEALLDLLLTIERKLGRVRSTDPNLRFGPRVIDLDILLFGEEQRQDAALTLPHPRMHERAFVLVPLLEIAPDLRLPGGRFVKEYLGGEGLAHQSVEVQAAEGKVG